jgi:hypothetical protein
MVLKKYQMVYNEFVPLFIEEDIEQKISTSHPTPPYEGRGWFSAASTAFLGGYGWFPLSIMPQWW